MENKKKFDKIFNEIGKEEYVLMITNSPDIPNQFKKFIRELIKRFE